MAPPPRRRKSQNEVERACERIVSTSPLDYRKATRRILQEALAAVDPYRAVLKHLEFDGEVISIGSNVFRAKDFDRLSILGAGKAGFAMARACEEVLGDALSEGFIIVKEGHGGKLDKFEVFEGSHPLPSEKNYRGCKSLLERANAAGERDLVILLISGGGSALLPAPVEGVSLEDKLRTTKMLLECGATIGETNCIRKHLSQIKGGGLARALAPARIAALVLSDVIGDRLDTIASGPITADSSSFEDSWQIIRGYGLLDQLPPSVIEHIGLGREGKRRETLKEGDPIFEKVAPPVIVGNNSMALEAARKKAEEEGFEVLHLSSTLEGESRELAKFFCALARERFEKSRKQPLLLLGGGETTVNVRGTGLGGRNQEFALACVRELSKLEGAFAIGFATDGTDGPCDAAGAHADWESMERASKAGLDPALYLENNDAYHFFEALGDLIKTGPTGSNVCDIYALGLL